MAKKKPRDSFYRTTISIPQDLKTRMDKAGEEVNWSAIAARAFEDKLGEIASRKERLTMADAIERLRASKRRGESASYQKGEKAGMEWAKDSADVKDLQALEDTREQTGVHWDVYFENDDRSAWGPGELLAFIMVPGDDRDRRDAGEWLESVLGEDSDELAMDGAFIRGFADGALAFWGEVKDQL